MGAHFIALHENDRNTQMVWKDYTTYMKTSTSADMQIEELMSSLTSLRLSQNYRGTTQKFLIDWLDKMMQYEKLTPLEAHFTPTVKKTMLQNAVQDFKAVKQVKTQDQIEVARGSGPLVFNQYISLLLNLSSTYDKKFEITQAYTQKRLVNMYQQDQVYVYKYENDNEYSWDTPINDEYFGSYIIQASERSRRFRPSLPRSVWNSLLKFDQQTWDQISPAGKWNVVKGLSESATNNNREKSPSSLSTDNKCLSTKLHEGDSNNSYNASDNNVSTFISPIASPNSQVQNSTTLINAARSSNTTSETDELHPADLPKFLSEDHVKKDATLSKPSTPTKFKSNTHIQYFVSRHQHDTVMRGSLVEKGANGGMAGNDLKIIATSDRKVDISGIDNHELTGLKIVTA